MARMKDYMMDLMAMDEDFEMMEEEFPSEEEMDEMYMDAIKRGIEDGLVPTVSDMMKTEKEMGY